MRKMYRCVLLGAILLCMSMAACSPKEGNELQESQSQSSEVASEQNPSEEYVYDYQVSLEPIPKEIADLGGPCVGTMHAFPSRIKVGLMKKKMEEDPEFKAEVEKCIQEIKESLTENYGGEFEVDLLEMSGPDW